MSLLRWRNLKRTGLALLALILLLLAVMIGLAVWLLGTGSGGRFALNQVPGLVYKGYEGKLGGSWRADRVEWRSDALAIVIEDIAMDWSPGCLWQREVCLDALTVASVAIETTPSEAPAEESAEPFSLPEINLPATISVGKLRLDRLTLNETLLLQDLALQGNLSGSDVHLDNLALGREDLELEVTGDLTMAGYWPVEANIQYRMPLLDDQLAVNLDARGRIGRNLHLEALVSGYVDGTLSGLVQPLEPGFPAELTVHPTQLPIPGSVPPTLRPEDVIIAAVGNLNDGWSVKAEAQLPAKGQPMPLVIEGHVTTEGARLDKISVTAAQQRSLTVAGVLGWSEGFTADATLSWREFPWQRLFPDMSALPVELQTLEGTINLADNAYEGQLEAAFTGPAGPSTLATPFRGDFGQISLPALSLQAGPGSVEGRLGLQFAEALGWDADLTIQALNPGYWVEAMPGTLSGRVQSEGVLAEAGPDLSAAIGLEGTLRDQPIQVGVELQGSPEQWQASPIRVRFGDNEITGSAGQSSGLDARLQLELTRLAQLWPGLEGSLTGELTASGWPDNLQAKLNLNSPGLGYNDTGLEALSVDVAINQEQISGGALEQSELDLVVTAVGIETAGQRIEQVRLNGSGSVGQHELRVRVEESRGNIDLRFEGGSELLRRQLAALGKEQPQVSGPAPVWTGALTDGEIIAAEQRWILQSRAVLAYDARGEVTLGAHCWAWESASLCAEDQRLWPDPRLRLALDNFSSELAAPFLPPELRWQGAINGKVNLDLDSGGPRGQILLDAGAGVFSARAPAEEDGAGPEWIDYPYDELRLTADLSPGAVVAQARLNGPGLGDLQANVTVDDPQGDVRPLRGEFALDELNLALFRPFADLQELAGTLNGTGQIGGTLDEPEVTGTLNLVGGQIADPGIPLQFDDVALQIQFTETDAELEGDWRSGEKGTGSIAGDIGWSNGLNATINVTGKRLPARLEPYADVEVAPDMTIAFKDEQLSITGRVAIPRGAVEIRELPPQAVSVSGDTVVVGQEEREETGPGLDLNMDLAVIVGEDELTFSGFGVTGELVGRLQIGNDLATRGELSLRDGRYEIYGQRLTLRRANLIFAGPISQPYLQIEAVRRVDDVTAGIRLTGPADQPQTEVFSEPSMSEEQALSYLILGRPLQSQQDNSVVGTAAISIGLNQAAPLTRALGKRVGVKDLQLDTEGSGDSQSIVATGYITDKLSIRYGISLFEAANRLALRYDLTEQLYLEAASGLASSLDIFYSRDYE